ncbi:hypothetical protein OQA88_10631 [Cercophora sp. LCS_1]
MTRGFDRRFRSRGYRPISRDRTDSSIRSRAPSPESTAGTELLAPGVPAWYGFSHISEADTGQAFDNDNDNDIESYYAGSTFRDSDSGSRPGSNSNSNPDPDPDQYAVRPFYTPGGRSRPPTPEYPFSRSPSTPSLCSDTSSSPIETIGAVMEDYWDRIHEPSVTRVRAADSLPPENTRPTAVVTSFADAFSSPTESLIAADELAETLQPNRAHR